MSLPYGSRGILQRSRSGGNHANAVHECLELHTLFRFLVVNL